MAELSTCPYATVPPHSKWREAMAGPVPECRPFAETPFRIGRSTRLASAGSCFAQRIAAALKAEGYSYLVTEPGGPFLPAAARESLGYGLYSARYGNVYTSAQLLQLFQRAFGVFAPDEPFWQNGQGRVVDPFRPLVHQGGFATEAEALADRARHLEAVRRMFGELDVFIFTLGLTEHWRSRATGAVYPAAPGCGLGGRFDAGLHVFHNSTVAEVVAEMGAFVTALAEVNPAARVILTVSPVPLAATYTGQHVLQATSHSKAVLRVAAQDLCDAFPRLAYFGSYEIVTATGDSAAAFAADRRSVSDRAVAHVIACFREQFLEGTAAARQAGQAASTAPGPAPMCDEAEIMAALARQPAGSRGAG
jgi:GSCFA family